MEVKNSFGSVVSVDAGLFVPALLANEEVALGSKAFFLAALTPEALACYQWRHNDNDIPAATNSALVITNVQRSDAGEYSATVSNRFGAVRLAATPLRVAAQVEQAWVARYDGPGSTYDLPQNLALDRQGQVYVAGTSGYGLQGWRYATIKYDANGNLLWAASTESTNTASAGPWWGQPVQALAVGPLVEAMCTWPALPSVLEPDLIIS